MFLASVLPWNTVLMKWMFASFVTEILCEHAICYEVVWSDIVKSKILKVSNIKKAHISNTELFIV